MSDDRWYRIDQPASADVLCRLSAPAEVVKCPANALHQRAGRYTAHPAVAAMPRKRFARTHFCHSWTWRWLASEALITALQSEGLTGFRAGPLDTAARMPVEAQGFVEFQIDWDGEFSTDPEYIRVRGYCPDCGLVTFDLLGDPPWSAAEIHSQADFFHLAPCFAAFCSERAYRVMQEICGNEFRAVPALAATGNLGRTRSFSWPHISLPRYAGDTRPLWERLLALDPGGVLPREMPGTRI